MFADKPLYRQPIITLAFEYHDTMNNNGSNIVFKNKNQFILSPCYVIFFYITIQDKNENTLFHHHLIFTYGVWS